MTDLPQDVRKQFFKSEKFVSVESVTKSSGIADLVPEALIDAYMFDPMGYSMNGLLDDGYMTVHVTPQENCSYASFETNIHCDYEKLLVGVLNVFQPHNFTVTLFAGNYPAKESEKLLDGLFSVKALEQYTEQSRVHEKFKNHYEVEYAHYKSPSKRKRKTVLEHDGSSAKKTCEASSASS